VRKETRALSRRLTSWKVAALTITLAGAALVLPSSALADITGTSGPDTLVGTPQADTLRGWRGDDRLDGRGGRDTVYGGLGNDTVYAADGTVDTIDCGDGRDSVQADASDVVRANCETRTGAAPGPAPGPAPSPSPSPSGSVVLVDRTWTCTGAVDLDLVKVTMRTADADAIHLRTNCTGRIGRIEVQTWTRDGLKVNAPAPAAHDLVIEGGYIRCYGASAGHQDGIQAMGGQRVTFRNLEVNCSSNPAQQFFVNSVNGGRPTDIVCEGCVLGARAASTLLVMSSTRSGARNSIVCTGRYFSIRIESQAVSPVNSGNTVVPATDPRCTPPPA
jgi:hypothetical protein